MENGFGYQLFRNVDSQSLPSPENLDGRLPQYPLGPNYLTGREPQSIFSDRYLEDVFSLLSLSSASRRQPSLVPAGLHGDFGYLDPVIDYQNTGGEGLFPLCFRGNANSQGLRLQNDVNGQMGFGGAHINPTAGAVSWESLGIGSYPTAATEAWQTDDGLNSGGGFHPENDGSFLQCKKQLGKQLKSQFSIVPCSNRSTLLTDYDQHFDGLANGYVSDNSTASGLNLYHQRLHQLAQYPDCLSLEDLRGHILYIATDQYKCRLLQKKFEDPTQEEIEMVLSEVLDHIGELMMDQFGNYLIQKLVKVCNEKQRTQIILSVTSSRFRLTSICLNPHGTRAVQKMLEYVTSQQQISMVMSALSPCSVALITDPNGHHVIQFCLIHFTNEDNKYLFNKMADNCFKIATSKSGCCVLQSGVEHSQGEYREQLVAQIIANALHLAEDRYGNYVLQHLLGLKIPEVTERLLRQLEGSYFSLSCNKFASNVVEKFLTDSGEEISSQIIMELLRSPKVCLLLVDPFGNFVIQSALSVSKGLIRNTLLNLVRVNVASMRTNIYGKKVLDGLNKMKLQRA